MNKILIIRFSSIGDIVLTSPIVRCLKNQLGNASEIHFLTKEKFSSVINSNPYISKTYTIKESVSEILTELIKENYSYIIDLHHNIRSLQVKRALKKPSFSYNKLNIEKWLMVNFKWNRLPQKHIVDRYFECVQAFGVKNDGNGLDYFIPAKDEVNISALPPQFKDGFVAFVIGGTYETKKLPTDKIISVCKKIKTPVILLGGKEDASAGNKVKLMSGEHVLNACGSYNINQSASLIKQAKKVITHDTGLMHIAAAFKKDIVSVWGNTIPGFGMYPYLPEGKGTSKVMEVKNLNCRPCSKLGYSKCPKKHFYCMNLLDEDEIAAE
jgi:ADP-heptose:LPS heptosyltransferase